MYVLDKAIKELRDNFQDVTNDLYPIFNKPDKLTKEELEYFIRDSAQKLNESVQIDGKTIVLSTKEVMINLCVISICSALLNNIRERKIN